MKRRSWRAACLTLGVLLLALLSTTMPVGAQPASSFYNVIGIEKKVLPNATQIIIRTDGIAIFGGDYGDFYTPEGQELGSRNSIRLRFLNARARLPAFIDLGAYPFDAAVVTLGREPFQSPFFSRGANPESELRVDIEVRFYVPIDVERFLVDDQFSGFYQGGHLSQREVSVEVSRDRRSVIITAVPDRADLGGAERIRRSPPETHRHRLSITPLNGERQGRYRVDALHTSLTEVLTTAGETMQLSFLVPPGAGEVDISLLLPAATPAEFLAAIANAYDLVIEPRPPEEGGGFLVGRGDVLTRVERLPLRNLAPEQARLLFPDFLLPSLRVDIENNALIVAGSPASIERMRRDLTLLDVRRPQVRVEATFWEFASAADAALALRASRVTPSSTTILETAAGTGTLAVRVEEGEERTFTATVQAFSRRNRARLRAKPFVVVASGTGGNLFAGQTRFVPVLRPRGGRQVLEVLELKIGYTLVARPTVGAGGEVTLEINPRVSTVDAIEAGTGLPTLGIREVNATLRVRPGAAIMVAGLDSDLDFRTRSELLGVPGARRRDKSQTTLVILVTARQV